MPEPGFVVSAMPVAALVVVASALVLWPTGDEVGSGGMSPEAVSVSGIDADASPGIRERSWTVRAEEGDDQPTYGTAAMPEPGTSQAVRSLPVGAYGDVSEYDPDLLYPASPSSLGVLDVGESLDPDLPPAPVYEGLSDVGDYLLPEERP